MILKEEDEYIRGSTVMIPKRREETTSSEDYEKIKKSNIIRKNKIKYKKNQKKRKALKTIAVIFALGFLLMLNETHIYKKQVELNKLTDNVTDTNKSIEDLNIKLIQLNGLSSIEGIAKDKLNMSMQNMDKKVKVTFHGNNFVEVPSDKNNDSQKSIISEIKDFFISNF
ncbi:hypothetical protein IAI10_08145 [Clostridium sp. 19966]|uniref:hypothetical protein n=1 Tax=Clostridium sp. 19966 TaxID=2768166 RepID=UPI0028DFB26B|nr:hypothetical protein [Clostridium sp. 19966]MDT8716625.1 hypothetical protein [Clostridium sp. 19966]